MVTRILLFLLLVLLRHHTSNVASSAMLLLLLLLQIHHAGIVATSITVFLLLPGYYADKHSNKFQFGLSKLFQVKLCQLVCFVCVLIFFGMHVPMLNIIPVGVAE